MPDQSATKGPEPAKGRGKSAAGNSPGKKAEMPNNRRGQVRDLQRGHAHAPRVQPDQSRSQDAKRDAKREKRSAS